MTVGEDNCAYQQIEKGKLIKNTKELQINDLKKKQYQKGTVLNTWALMKTLVSYVGLVNKTRVTKEYYPRVKRIWSLFTSLRALFIWKSGNVTSIVSITHTVIFSKQEVSRSWQRMVGQETIHVRETVGRKNNCKLNFFSMYFVRTNEEIHLSFKNSGKQRTQALNIRQWR